MHTNLKLSTVWLGAVTIILGWTGTYRKRPPTVTTLGMELGFFQEQLSTVKLINTTNNTARFNPLLSFCYLGIFWCPVNEASKELIYIWCTLFFHFVHGGWVRRWVSTLEQHDTLRSIYLLLFFGLIHFGGRPYIDKSYKFLLWIHVIEEVWIASHSKSEPLLQGQSLL